MSCDDDDVDDDDDDDDDGGGGGDGCIGDDVSNSMYYSET